MTTITAEQLKALSPADLLLLVNKMAADREAALAATKVTVQLRCKVSEKGGLSVYGLQRFPVTFYKAQWLRLAAFMPSVTEFIKANDAALKSKGD